MFKEFTVPVSIGSMRSLVAYNTDQISERFKAGLKITDVFKELGEALIKADSNFTGSYEGFRRAVGLAGLKKSASQIEISKAKALLRNQTEKLERANPSPEPDSGTTRKSFNTNGIDENDLF